MAHVNVNWLSLAVCVRMFWMPEWIVPIRMVTWL